jgi:hypothetical protein
MVDIQFADDPTAEAVKRATNRIQAAGKMPRGIVGGRALSYDADEDILQIHFDQLRRALIEHRMFEEADGFSSTELALLRIIETGPDRMRFDEIKAVAKDHDDIDDSLEDGTFQHYLRNLRDKGLVEHDHNQYTYLGP